jgi:hypothetical protein
MNAADLLTPAQMLRRAADDERLSAHVRECAGCGTWLESHRHVGTALQTLRASTEQREAGPAVGQAVLQAFRTRGFAPKVVVMPERTPPVLGRLNRFFEVGAYAAVAAALIVGLFLGARILRDKQTISQPVQAQSVSAPASNKIETTVAGNGSSDSKPAEVAAATNPVRTSGARSVSTAAKTTAAETSAETNSNERAGYTAVMLCDPLICSGDEQVVRMELPATAAGADGGSGRSVMADVVIGEDGLVRAMRIVND